jgi:putative flippase GtrA
MTRQFARFVLVGGFAAAINVLVRLLMSSVMPFEAAIVVAFVVALAVAFGLNRWLVFRTTGRAGQQFQRFLVVNLLALGQVWLISVALARWGLPAMHFTWHAETVAHVIGVASPVVTSYFAHKHFSFT